MISLYGIKLDYTQVKNYKPGKSKKKYRAYKRLRRSGFTPLSLTYIRK